MTPPGSICPATLDQGGYLPASKLRKTLSREKLPSDLPNSGGQMGGGSFSLTSAWAGVPEPSRWNFHRQWEVTILGLLINESILHRKTNHPRPGSFGRDRARFSRVAPRKLVPGNGALAKNRGNPAPVCDPTTFTSAEMQHRSPPMIPATPRQSSILRFASADRGHPSEKNRPVSRGNVGY